VIRAISVVLLLVLARCAGEPELFLYSGKVHNGRGEPLAHRSIALGRSSKRSCPIFLRADDEREQAYEPFASFETNDAGELLLELTRPQVQFSRPSEIGPCFQALIEGKDSAALTEVDFDGVTRDRNFPPLLLWEDAILEVEASPSGWTLGRPELPFPEKTGGASPMDLSRLYYQWRLETAAGRFWRARANSIAITLPAEVMEDFAAPTASLELLSAALLQSIREAPGGLLLQRARTQAVPLTASGLIPVSREAPCHLNGELAPGCKLTDGSPALFDLVAAAKRRPAPPS
jgi:hypothetical protein